MAQIDPSLLLILWIVGFNWVIAYECNTQYYQQASSGTKGANALINLLLFVGMIFYITG